MLGNDVESPSTEFDLGDVLNGKILTREEKYLYFTKYYIPKEHDELLKKQSHQQQVIRIHWHTRKNGYMTRNILGTYIVVVCPVDCAKHAFFLMIVIKTVVYL